MAEKNTPILSPEYLDFRNEITSRIRSAQYEALKAVNKEMIALYWEIGRRITEQQAALGWGKSVVENLSRDIQKEFPGIKGFGVRGIYTIFAADWFPSDFFRVGGLKGNRVKFPDRPAAVKLRQSSGQSVPLAVSCREGVRMRSQSEDLPTIYGFNRTRGPVGWIAL